ncbi:unnamed protein product [Orchesella dallaii]|uniref:Uncharacterized protein n=1 Tax=Orchesella dallaii TaxID=48710 RepID=A0ABP1QXU0_9HEXA
MNVNESTNSYVHCPHCTYRLDIRFVSEFVHSDDDESFAYNLIAIPDESGDSVKNQFFLKADKNSKASISNPMSQISKDLAKVNAMVLAPQDFTVCQGVLPKPPVKRRIPRPQVEKKCYGKNTIFRLPGNPPGNDRSRSFIIAPAPASGSVIRSAPPDNIATYNMPIASTAKPTPTSSNSTYICSNSNFSNAQPHATTRFPAHLTTRNDFHETLDILETSASSNGLDTVEIATLYDSSASSSCESLTQGTTINSAPSCSPRSLNSNNSNPSLTSLGFSVNESDQCLEGMPEIVPERVNSEIFDYDDIPKYRRDIYKDCLTLFLEGLLGRLRLGDS